MVQRLVREMWWAPRSKQQMLMRHLPRGHGIHCHSGTVRRATAAFAIRLNAYTMRACSVERADEVVYMLYGIVGTIHDPPLSLAVANPGCLLPVAVQIASQQLAEILLAYRTQVSAAIRKALHEPSRRATKNRHVRIATVELDPLQAAPCIDPRPVLTMSGRTPILAVARRAAEHHVEVADPSQTHQRSGGKSLDGSGVFEDHDGSERARNHPWSGRRHERHRLAAQNERARCGRRQTANGHCCTTLQPCTRPARPR